MDYPYQTSECVPRLFPVMTFTGQLIPEGEGKVRFVRQGDYQRSQWGKATAPFILDKKVYPLPASIRLEWMSVTEAKAYSLEAPLNKSRMEQLWLEQDKDGTPIYNYIVVGMAPYGGVAVWLRGLRKSILLQWLQAGPMDDDKLKKRINPLTSEDYCLFCLKQDEVVLQHLREHGLPPRDQYDRWMRQFRYRYRLLEEYWDGQAWQHYNEEDLHYDDMDIQYIREERYDGTHHDMGDTALMRYHKTGLPRRMAVRWQEGRRDYEAFLWFDHAALAVIMDRLLTFDPDAEATLLLRLDTHQRQHGMAIEGGIVTNPITIPQEVYELLVFQGDNELWRSPNFSREDEAEWQW